MKKAKKESGSKRQAYGLLTVISMIVGIVVGSGIFYKADDMIINAGGNLAKAIAALALGAFSIIFGALTLSEFAIRTKTNGGFVAYFEKFTNKKIATAFAWFQTFLYIPSLTAVVAWASAIYTFLLFGYNPAPGPWLIQTCLLGFAYMVVFTFMNFFSRKAGGRFQAVTTIIKLLPLFLIAIVGLCVNYSDMSVPAVFLLDPSFNEGIAKMQSMAKPGAWLAALPAVAFSYDGWVLSTTIAPEVRNPKRNMRLGFIIAPVLIFLSYALFVIGMYRLLGSNIIAGEGNNAINNVIAVIFSKGDVTAETPVINAFKIILNIIVVLAILGVENGLIMAGIRMPQSLASKGMISDKSKKIAKIDDKHQLSLKSTLISLGVATIYMVVHYITQKKNVFNGGDIAEVAIVFSYITYIILYVKVMIMKKKKIIKNVFTGYITPILAITGSLSLFIGSIILSFKASILELMICLIVFLAGGLYAYLREQRELVARLQERARVLEEHLSLKDTTTNMFLIENIDDDNDEFDEMEAQFKCEADQE